MGTAGLVLAALLVAPGETVVQVPSAATRQIDAFVAPQMTAFSLLSAHLPRPVVLQVLAAARPLHDLSQITVGRPFAVTLAPGGAFAALRYEIDDTHTLHVAREGLAFRARIVTEPRETRTVTVAAQVQSTLFAAVEAAGEGEPLALRLAEIFAWEVDFAAEIRSGDSFQALVDKLYLDGRFVGYGGVRAARLRCGGRTIDAFRHEGRAGTGYYDAQGRPLRGAFLRSPLRFTRISSGFSRSRRHPILGGRRPHLGIDYAAPSGTPVHAVADGLVIAAGWAPGYGRTIHLRHADGYETLYGHLSRIDVRRGARVRQGARLGAVGASGLATGPHLDYRMLQAGRFVDPLRVRVPRADPLPAGERPAFLDRTRALALQLARAPRAPGPLPCSGRSVDCRHEATTPAPPGLAPRARTGGAVSPRGGARPDER